MMQDKNQKIAVIGAGPMGLAVAYELCLQGYKPVIYEADDRVGGMTATFDFNGVEIERYYHFHCTSDLAFFELLKELSLDDQMRWVSTKMGYWYQNQLQPWGNPIALLTFKGLSLVAKFRYGLHAFLSTKRNNWRPLEKYDAKTWIQRWVGAEAYEVLWKKLFAQKFYEFTDNLSAPWIWSRIRRIGRSRYNLFNEKLGYLQGGSGRWLKQLQAKIEAMGGEFKLSSPVEKIEMLEDKATGVWVNGQFISADKVISTIPLPFVPKIAPQLPQQLLAQYANKKNIAVVCVIAQLNRPLTENFWLNTNDEAMDIPGIIEYSNLNPNVGHIVYVPYYMPQTNPVFKDADEVFVDKVTRYFKTVNPDLTDENILDVRVSRYYYAQPICEPNFLDTLPPEQVLGNLWIADTSYYYPEDRGISESIGYGRAMAKRAIVS